MVNMKTSLSRRVEPQKNVINPSILQAVRPRKKYPMAFDNVVKNIPENRVYDGARAPTLFITKCCRN